MVILIDLAIDGREGCPLSGASSGPPGAFAMPDMSGRTGASRYYLIVLTLVSLVVFAGCSQDKTMPIGFLGALEGKNSDLGVQGRNGVQLAIEQANAQGGIAGRTFRLVAADDGHNPDQAVSALRELASGGVKVVIGPMTSAVAMAIVPEAERLRLLLLSPTTATPTLAGIDDCFFRLLTVNTLWAKSLAIHAAKDDGTKSVVIVADNDNADYSKAFLSEFLRVFSEHGGRENETFWIDSHEMQATAWTSLATRIAGLSPEGLVLSLGARDAASLARAMLSQAGSRPRVYSAMWAATTELLLEGGRAVEGWTFGMGYTEESDRESFSLFKTRYRERFGFDPNFAAALGYESALALFAAMDACGADLKKLPKALQELQNIPGVIGEFSLDSFGDVRRETFVVGVENGAYKTIATIPWSNP